MYDEYIDALIDLAQAATTLTVASGTLPPKEGVAVSASGGNVSRYLGGDSLLKLSFAVNAKCAKQADVLTALGDIHAALLPSAPVDREGWQMTGITIRSAPAYMGQDQSNMHIYTSAIEARIYIRR